ncbi:MAG: hypothetical protein IH599_04775 [Bacteroidales bacterium]|nr:hypothetical protein [Bacteroidales bacterium]
MKINILLVSAIVSATLLFFISCGKDDDVITDTTDQISIDSLVSTAYVVKAWDTVLISCYASGEELAYAWECDHGSVNGSGFRVKYAAGECCVGLNTVSCVVSNPSGHVTKSVQIKVTSYFGGGK